MNKKTQQPQQTITKQPLTTKTTQHKPDHTNTTQTTTKRNVVTRGWEDSVTNEITCRQ